jgi:hypothetical protein
VQESRPQLLHEAGDFSRLMASGEIVGAIRTFLGKSDDTATGSLNLFRARLVPSPACFRSTARSTSDRIPVRSSLALPYWLSTWISRVVGHGDEQETTCKSPPLPM